MEHYYSENPNSELKLKKIRQRILDDEFSFYSSSGVFSKDKVDAGTLILAESMKIGKESKVLDIGCGIGILGVVAAKVYGSDIVMCDLNKRAVLLAKKNAELNKVDAKILQSDLYEKITDNDFDVILSNPPQNAGKEVCFRIIEEAKNHLKQNGALQLVARHNKGGKMLSGKMKEVFGNADVLSKKSGYWVYCSRKL